MKFIVEFSKSSSPSFATALAIAESSSNFSSSGDDQKKRYSVTYDHLVDFMDLARYVRGWKSGRFIVDKKVLSVLDFMRLSSINECYVNKQEFINKKRYCLTGLSGERLIFPCRFIHIRDYEFAAGIYGEVQGDEVLIDKDLLKFALEQRARQSMCYCCPDMNLVKLLSLADDFPDTIELAEGGFLGARTIKPVGLADPIDQDSTKLDEMLKDIEGI